MPVAPVGWLSNSLAAVEDLLANCTTYRTLLGAADVAAAKDLTTWQTARDGRTAPYAILSLAPGDESEAGIRGTTHRNSVAVLVAWASQRQGGDTEKDATTRAVNSWGTLLEEIKALVGTGPYLVRAERSWEPPERVADDLNAGVTDQWDATITFTWDI